MRRAIVRPTATLVGLLAVVLLALSSREAVAGTLSYTATSDAYAESPTGNGTYSVLNSNPAGDLVIRQIAGVVQDVALMSFDLSSLPTNATITGVSFNFYEQVETTNVGRDVNIEGFGGSVPLTLGDATASATVLGQYDNVALGTGNQSLSLSLSAFQGLLTSGSALKIRLQGTQDGTNTGIASLGESGFFISPQLVITTASVPEPSFLAMIAGAGLVGLIGRGLRRRAAR
jgi:hypothetical protein